MSIAATQATSELQANPAGYTATRQLKQTLGSEDFMKLLSTQMATQDPMKPMEDTAFISQMASFSSLAQMNQLTNDFSILKANQAVTAAASFIGRSVTVQDVNSASGELTGEVTGVDTSGSEPTVKIGGEYYALSSVMRIDAGTAGVVDTTTL